MRMCEAGGASHDSCICMLGQPLRFHHWKCAGNEEPSTCLPQSQQKCEPHCGHFIWLQPPAFSTGLLQHGQGLLMRLMSAWFLRFSSCISRSYSVQEPLPACADEWK